MDRALAAPRRAAKNNNRHLERGLQFVEQQRWEEAARALGQATRELPRHALTWLNLAQAQRKLGQMTDAAESAQRVLSLDAEPGLARMARRLLASALAGQGLAEQAADTLQPLIDAGVTDPEVYLEAGDARVQARQFVVALQLFMRAAQIKPHAPEAHIGLGNCLEQLGMPSSASECFRTASILDPRNTQVLGSGVHMAMHACRWTDLDADLAQLTARLKQGGPLLPMPFSHLSFPGSTAAEHRQTAAHFWKTQTAGTQPLPQRSPAQRKPGRLRVGYLSNDFHEHATSRLIIEVLERHDRDNVEVFLYSYGVDDGSDLRRRVIASSEHFVEMQTLAPRAMAERIYADHIDILVDLKGYTQGCRTAVLGYRPAPIQVNWLGFPGTMATPLVDYLITDPVVTPLTLAADYDEKFAYLPHTYQPNDRQRPVGPVPSRAACGLPETGVVFCCFNNTYKITPALFDIWCRLLTQVPGSVLWLLEANMEARDNLLREAQARGVEAQRIVFAPKVDITAHLARLSLADIVLDTLPYNAHTTASDALWVGVPVVTCPGNTFASRVAASLLTATGVADTIANSLAAYETTALRLATDAQARTALRQSLIDGRGHCALFDASGFARDLEALYQRMHARWVDGQAPDHLAPELRTAADISAGSVERRYDRVPNVLTSFLGGPQPAQPHRPRVAVITPYYKERRAWLERCITSVKAQDYEATHFMVADGFPQDWIDGAGVRHIRLDQGHADYGNTPRAIGGMLAVSEGFDAICFLDADNWYRSDHISTCLTLAHQAEEPLDYVIACRDFVRDDGSVIPMPGNEDHTGGHVDTNCYFLLRGAFHTIPRWCTMPKPLAVICDRVYRLTLEVGKLRSAKTHNVTVNYLCTWRGPYRAIGETPPDFAKEWIDPFNYLQWWKALPEQERQYVDRLLGYRIALN